MALYAIWLAATLAGLYVTLQQHALVLQALLTWQWPAATQEAVFHVAGFWVFAAFVGLAIHYANQKLSH